MHKTTLVNVSKQFRVNVDLEKVLFKSLLVVSLFFHQGLVLVNGKFGIKVYL